MSIIRQLYYLKNVRKNQWKKLDELKKIQNQKLRVIINYAYHNVAFYHDLFKKEKIFPSDIKNVDDLNKIPILSKEDIRKNYPHDIISKNANINKCKIWETSGSTGIPLKITYDSKSDDFAKAIIIRSYLENGLKFFDKWCVLGPPEYRTEKNRLFFIGQKIGFLCPFYISVFEPFDDKIKKLKTFKPRFFDSMSTDLILIAKYIKENNIEDIKPEIITTNGEFLDDSMRQYINNVFGIELSDVYGCFEFRRTAWECTYHDGYHIDMDSIVMQFLRDGEEVSPGENGKIVLTGLYNFTMPLIRYDIGDEGIPVEHMCSCGRNLPLMKITKGKMLDFLVADNNSLISPHVAKEFLMCISGIEIFKVTQQSREKIEILIVKNDSYKDEYTTKIANKFYDLLGKNISIDIEFVEDIERKNRKYKVIESKIQIGKTFI